MDKDATEQFTQMIEFDFQEKVQTMSMLSEVAIHDTCSRCSVRSVLFDICYDGLYVTFIYFSLKWVSDGNSFIRDSLLKTYIKVMVGVLQYT